MITYNAITQESRKHKALDGQTLENNYKTLNEVDPWCHTEIRHSTTRHSTTTVVYYKRKELMMFSS